MLVIITTHPIQYQVPLWRMLARDGRVPFEVWYLTHHAVATSRDPEFGRAFAWDIDMLGGYPHRLLNVAPGGTPATFRRCRLVDPLEPLLQRVGARVVWVQGWQVLAYWQAVWAAKRAGCEVWLRAESNDLAPVAWWKWPVKKVMLGSFFHRVDRFLCIGSANRRLYRQFGVPEARLADAPYAVDNDRFAAHANALRPQRRELRSNWGIAEDAFCAMFCGKFITKKRPLDLVAAAQKAAPSVPDLHLLFVGSGDLGAPLRAMCNVAFDADRAGGACRERPNARDFRPLASFAGFLNQTEISQAYVVADCLVLPSDHGETWGLVVNEAMASGLPCIISDRCGSAEDLGGVEPNMVFPFGDTDRLAKDLAQMAILGKKSQVGPQRLTGHSFARTAQSVIAAYRGLVSKEAPDEQTIC